MRNPSQPVLLEGRPSSDRSYPQGLGKGGCYHAREWRLTVKELIKGIDQLFSFGSSCMGDGLVYLKAVNRQLF